MDELVIKELRDIPQVEKVLADSRLAEFIAKYSHQLTARIVRRHLELLRERIKAGQTLGLSRLMEEIIAELNNLRLLLTNHVINATGIVVHTNLGRAPLGAGILERLKEKIWGYSTLEFDLQSGERGSRGAFLFELLSAMTGAEAGLAVNNNAAAVMLILNTFGLGRKCIVSRGEQVQIGGGFRMHEVAQRSGVSLVEVGSTNRTTIEDYRAAIDDQTAILLKVHLSNFRQIGFTEEAALKELVALGQERKVAVVHDLGSGAFLDFSQFGISREPTISDSLLAGADVVCFSGDKLLGGPQAGVILGKQEKIAAIKKNPLYRTVRLDKIVIALLEELLLLYMKNQQSSIPLVSLLLPTPAELRKRAEKIVADLASFGIESEVVETEAYCGGGSLPEESFPSIGIAYVPSGNPQKLARKLRLATPPVIGRISEGRLILDLRTVFPAEDGALIDTLGKVVGEA